MAPAGGTEGRIFWDTDDNKLKVDDGTNVVPVAGNLFYTGLITGGELTINGGDATKFDIAAGEGVVVDNHADPTNPVITRVTWSALSAQTPTGAGTTNFTYLAFNSSGALVQSTSAFTALQTRDLIVIGRVVHLIPSTTISVTVMTPQVAFNSVMEFFDFSKVFGSINISGNVYSANGANLNVNRNAGQSYRLGANYPSSKKRPSITDDSASTALSFVYSYRDGSGGWTNTSTTTTIDPANYDDGDGTLGSVPALQFTIQTITFAPGSSATAMQYGQALYLSMGDAEANLTDTIEFNPALDQNTFRGWLIVRGNATDLSDPLQAKFISAGKFGLIDIVSGSSGGEANTASNIGVGGVGFFKQKSGVDLQFKNANAGSARLTITDDVVNNEVDFDVNASPASSAVVGTGRTISTTAPLAGGGDLSADRTLTISVSPGAATTVVGTTRTISTTAPIRIDAGASADLSADRTISVNDATTSTKGVVQVGSNVSVSAGTISVVTLDTAVALQTTVTSNASGVIDMDSGALALPRGTVTPTAGNEGRVFWDTNDDQLFVDDGAAFQPIEQRILNVNNTEATTSSTTFTETAAFSANLFKIFPTGVVLQSQLWFTGGGGSPTTEARLFNITDATALVSITGVTASAPGTFSESSSATPTNAVKDYALQFRRVGGTGTPTAHIRGAILRRT